MSTACLYDGASTGDALGVCLMFVHHMLSCLMLFCDVHFPLANWPQVGYSYGSPRPIVLRLVTFGCARKGGSQGGLAKHQEHAMPLNKFSLADVRTIVRAGRKGLYADGGGLWLQITASGSASWIFRYQGANGL